MQRSAEGERARQAAGRLTGEGVRAVALTWVDNAGSTDADIAAATCWIY